MAGKFKPVALRSKPTPIDPHESGGGRSLDLRTTQRHEAEPAFKLTMVVKKPTATSLYTVDPLDPNHDATMRIEGEGSEAAAAHSFSRCRDHGGTAGYRYLGSFLAFRRYARRGAKTLYFFSCCRLRR